MKTIHQFWHLLKFQAQAMPWYLWLVILGLSIPLGVMQWFTTKGDTSLNMGDNLFAMIYFFILALQCSWGLRAASTSVTVQNWANGSQDFLWTRAVDRGVLFWAKLTIFLLICSLVWVNATGLRFVRSEPVRVVLFGGAGDQAFKAALLAAPNLEARVAEPAKKGSSREVVVLDHGAAVISGLVAWKVAAIALLVMWFALVLRRRGIWMLGVFFVCLTGWIALSLGAVWLRDVRFLEGLTYRNQILAYAHGAGLWWMALGIVGAFAIWDGRRRYLRPE